MNPKPRGFHRAASPFRRWPRPPPLRSSPRRGGLRERERLREGGEGR